MALRSLIPVKLEGYIMGSSILVVLPMALAIFAMSKRNHIIKMQCIALYLAGIALYALIEYWLNSSSAIKYQGMIESLHSLQTLPLIHSNFNTADLGRYLIFPLYTTFESLVALKTLKIKFADRRIWFFYLATVNFINGLLGLHCVSVSLLLNSKLTEPSKSRSAKIWLMVISVVLYVVCPPEVSNRLRKDLWVYTSLISLLLYYTFNFQSFLKLFGAQKLHFVLFTTSFGLLMITQSVFVSCAVIFALEWCTYAFESNKLGDAITYTAAGSQVHKYDLADWHEDVGVYKLEGCVNFLRTAYHLKRIKAMPNRIIVLDLEDVLQGCDKDFGDSYEDLINKARHLHSKMIVVHGWKNKEPANYKDKYF